MTQTAASKDDTPIKKTAARMLAVQAVYQNLNNPQSASVVINDFLSTRTAMEVEGEEGIEVMALPDGAHFKKIVSGVFRDKDNLEAVITAHLTDKSKELEFLLTALLLCAAYELVFCQEIDSPIIINDYVEVAKSFYEGGESRLVNAVLDKIATAVR